MSNELAGEVVLVTGANRGIGRQISTDLAVAGATVILSARDVVSLEDVERQINSAGGQCESVCLDVTQEQMVVDVVDGIVSRHGRLDLLVNNAGIGAGSEERGARCRAGQRGG